MRQRVRKIRIGLRASRPRCRRPRNDAVKVEIEDALETRFGALLTSRLTKRAPGLSTRGDLAQRGIDVDDVAQRKSHRGAVERVFVERHRHHVAFDELAVRAPVRRALARDRASARKSRCRSPRASARCAADGTRDRRCRSKDRVCGPRGRREQCDRAPPPALVHSGGHHAIGQVVARRDRANISRTKIPFSLSGRPRIEVLFMP